MTKINSAAELRSYRAEILARPKAKYTVLVGMATCGIASGAKQTMEAIIDECNKQNVKAVVTQTGCMGYCYAEPTVEVKKPGHDPIVYGHVDTKKGQELVTKYIMNDEILEGVIPVNYEKIDK